MNHESLTIIQIFVENIAKRSGHSAPSFNMKETLENAPKNMRLMIKDWGYDKIKTKHKLRLGVTVEVVRF